VHQANLQGVNFGRRYPSSGGQYCTPKHIAPHGQALERATVRQRKTGHPVRFELTEPTREAIDGYIKAAGKRPGQFLFACRGGCNQAISTRQYARLVSRWIASIGLNPSLFGTHSLRRTKVTLIYRRTGSPIYMIKRLRRAENDYR
jgi:integrase